MQLERLGVVEVRGLGDQASRMERRKPSWDSRASPGRERGGGSDNSLPVDVISSSGDYDSDEDTHDEHDNEDDDGGRRMRRF